MEGRCQIDNLYRHFSFVVLVSTDGCQLVFMQEPAKKWETLLLGLGASGSEPGVETLLLDLPTLPGGAVLQPEGLRLLPKRVRL